MLQKVRAIRERMEYLTELLPEPSESIDYEPPGVYYELRSCLELSPEHLEEVEFCIGGSLDHTPETLRDEWLEEEKGVLARCSAIPLPPMDGFWSEGG